MSISIATSAMLVEVSIRTWTARKLDRGVTDEVTKSKHASRQAGRFNKNLLADAHQLEAVQCLTSEIRQFVYSSTMPWSDTGPRLLPTSAFHDFKQSMAKYEAEFCRLVNNFVTMYPTLITSQAFKLGTMFDRDDFPSAEEVESKFSFRLTFSPVPESGDFRVDISSEAEVALKEAYDEAYEQRLNGAMNDVKSRLRSALEKVSERLEYDGGKKKVFRNSTVDNLKDVLVRANLMNLVDDQDLEDARLKAERLIDSVSMDELRKDDHIRKDVKVRVDDILDKFRV